LNKIIIFVLCIIPFLSIAQVRPGINPDIDNNEKQENPKKKSVPSHVKSWKLSDFGSFSDSVKIDTLLKYYHNYNPIYRQNISNTFTGNYGGSYLSNNFSSRNYNTEFYFFRTHDAYLLTPYQINYFNTTTPYTLLDYSQSESKSRSNETRLNVLHSQNIRPNLNITFRFDQAKSEGQYNFQENKISSICLYSSYNSEKINIYGGFIFNRISNLESGGLSNDEDIMTVKPEWAVMRLADASNSYKNSYFFTNGEYKLGITKENEEEKSFKPIAGILWSFMVSNNTKLFREGQDEDNSAYFTESWLKQKYSNDSVRFNSMTSLFQLKFYESADRKFSFGKRAFAGLELVKNSYAAQGYSESVFPFHPGSFTGSVYEGPSPRWYNKNIFNAFLGGGIYRESGKFWTWYFDGRQYLTGIKAGQTELNGRISKPVHLLKDSLAYIRIDGNLSNRTPDYFQQRYFSNRIKWNNDFANEQIMDAAFTYSSPVRNLEAGAKYSLINNFIYHDTLGIPAQAKGGELILSAYLNKEFKLGNFNLLSQMLWQKASAPQYIHLPDFSARIVISFNMIVAKVLFLQLGADTRYNTAYFADAYHPVTGLFYLQNKKKLGNLPYMDAFVNAKLKRTRIFFQYMNVGSLFLNKYWFTALHYPMNKATYRLGVAWSFYD
jgi:hypothetical protein